MHSAHLYFFNVSGDKGAEPEVGATDPVQNPVTLQKEKLRPVEDNLAFSSWLHPLYHCGSSISTGPHSPNHSFKNSRARHSGSTPNEQTTQTHAPRGPQDRSLALRRTNLSQNRQGVCRLSWGRSAPSSSSQAASSPLSDSSGRSSSSAAPRPPGTHKRSDLPRTPGRTARTRSRVGRRLCHAGERSPRPAPRRPSPALPPFPARPPRPGSASQRAQGEGRVFPQPH